MVKVVDYRAGVNPTKAAHGGEASERARVAAQPDSNLNARAAAVAASLDSDNPPGPPAGTPPQVRR
jgi:hypothetical protein